MEGRHAKSLSVQRGRDSRSYKRDSGVGTIEVSSEQWRMFCAVELPKVIRTRLEKHIERVRNAVPESQPSWTRVNNIHLTLKFFGNVEHTRVSRITDALSRAIENVSQFKVSIGGAGAFPNNRQPRVLWIGINDSNGQLKRLHESVEAECDRKGFEREARAYRPH